MGNQHPDKQHQTLADDLERHLAGIKKALDSAADHHEQAKYCADVLAEDALAKSAVSHVATPEPATPTKWPAPLLYSVYHELKNLMEKCDKGEPQGWEGSRRRVLLMEEIKRELATPSATALSEWAAVEKAKADAYEAAAVICEEMSYPPEGQDRWHGKEDEWAAIKLEDAAKNIRERKAKVCQVTQAIKATDGTTKGA